MGNNGGIATRDKMPPDFFREIGRKGGQAAAALGKDHMREIGKRGGNATKAKLGREHYAEIGRKGGQNGRGVAKVGAGRHKR